MVLVFRRREQCPMKKRLRRRTMAKAKGNTAKAKGNTAIRQKAIRQYGEVSGEMNEQEEAKSETVGSGQATDVVDFGLAHGTEDAVDMENRGVQFQQTTAPAGHAENRNVPGKHAVLR